jgi:HD-GYP domain-containing protein (c-di-GMP phosphodiesterase class II)
MRFTELSVVRHRVAVGEPLPFNVFNNDQTLLLAKGQRVNSTDQMQALFDRGTLVDIAELQASGDEIHAAPPKQLAALWTENISRMHRTLTHAEGESFREALDEAAKPVATLIDRDPDLAILQVLRQEGNQNTQYGLNHAIHTAIVCRLVAKRLQWNDEEANRAFKAALTMNLSMFELQGILANHPGRPNEEQKALIHSHPRRSREMLERAGVTDPVWLEAVEQHHETPDRKGYPGGIANPSELASLLHRADVYAAKLSPRANRDPLPADRAGREIFMRDPGNPITAALVKEFGVYPPGCYVALASGEVGVVVKRGPTVMAPLVAVLVNKSGEAMIEPLKRDTTNPAHAVTGVVPARAIRIRLSPDKLAAIALG